MSMFFQHTDEDGTRVLVHTRADGDLLAEIFPVEDPGLGHAVDLPEADGRRLLAKLQRYYALLDGQPEPAHGGTVATQTVWVCTRCGVRRQEANPPFCWGCGYGETVATQEPAVHAEEANHG